jgi:hypothetical protein
VWKVVSKSTDILAYVRCSYAWLDLVQRYYSEREMYVLLGNLALRLEETYSLDSRAEVRACMPLLPGGIGYRPVLPGSSAWTGAPVLTRTTTRVGYVTVTTNPNSSLQCNVQVPEPVLQQLEALVSSLIGQSSTFGTAVLTSEHLLKILDVFRGLRKVVLCKVGPVDVVQNNCCAGSQLIELTCMVHAFRTCT